MDDEFIFKVTEEELAQFPEEEGKPTRSGTKYSKTRIKERDTTGNNCRTK